MIKSNIIKRRKVFNIGQKSYSEEFLIKQSQYGNDNSFEKLMDIYESYLYKMAFLYLKNEHDALDIYQETVLKAYMNISKLKDPKSFKTWITKILINNIYTRSRHYNKFQDECVEDCIGDFSYSNIEEKLEYMYASGFGSKSYEDDINTKEYKIKNGMVYDSIVTDNHYGIGYYNTTQYIIVKFLDLKDKSEDNVTEFKVYINNDNINN